MNTQQLKEQLNDKIQKEYDGLYRKIEVITTGTDH